MGQPGILTTTVAVLLLLFHSTQASITNHKVGCVLCKSFASVAIGYLQPESTQNAVDNLLADHCEKSTMTEACNVVRTSFLPRLFDHLSPDRSPELTCLQSGFCDGDERIRPDEDPNKAASCYVCTEILEFSKTIANLPQTEFIEKLLLSCQTLDFFDAVCRLIVQENSAEIYKLTQQNVPPKAGCFQMQLCDNNITDHPPFSKDAVDNDCSLCRTIVEHSRTLQLTEKSQSSLVAAVARECSQWGDGSADCDRFLKEHFDTLFPLLHTRMTGDSVCSTCLNTGCE